MIPEGEIPSWYCPYKIPKILLETPQPLVLLIGLNKEENQVHRCIWEMLNLKNSMKDYKINYILASADYSLAPKKTKAETVENYIPSGLLKYNWCSKHTKKIASAAVIFFDINWTDEFWNEKKTECAKLVKNLREELGPHGIQSLLMLIKSPTAGDENFSTEKAQALCTAAEIPPKYLFVLAHTHTDRIQACIQRLEGGFPDISRSYYLVKTKSMMEKMKLSKDKSAQLPLHVRYNFKIGFFQEIRRDVNLAISHYQAASEALFSIKPNDSNIQEMKVVGGILVYRLCRLYLLNSDIKSCKAQFEKHISVLGNVTGNPQLLFEHYAWMEYQYHNYADLLKQHFKLGVNALPDPVTYYLKAAHFARLRKKFYQEKLSGLDLFCQSDMNVYNRDVKLEYLGQRPWRINSFSPQNMFATEDKNGLVLVQQLEQKVNHLDCIIDHLGRASDFCREKTQRSRTRCQLMNMMGLEFYNEKHYSKCVMLMSHVIREFGGESWKKILFFVADLGLRAALAEGDVPKYLNFLIFLLKRDLSDLVGTKEQKDLWENFQTVLESQIPSSSSSMNVENWTKALKDPFISYVEVHTHSILECQAHFMQESVKMFSKAKINFAFMNQNNFPITIRKFGVRFIPEGFCEVSESLTLEPNDKKEISIDFTPSSKDAQKIVRIQVAYVDIGRNDKSVFLHYSLALLGNSYLWNGEGQKEEYKETYIKVEPTKPMIKVRVAKAESMILNDWNQISVFWRNVDVIPITKLYVVISISNIPSIFLATKPEDQYLLSSNRHLNYNFEYEGIKPGEEAESVVYYLGMDNQETESKLILKGKYYDSNNQGLSIESVEPMELIAPFETVQTILNDEGAKIENVCLGENFSLFYTIRNISKSPLLIHDIQIENIASSCSKTSTDHQFKDILLKETETLSTFFMLKLNEKEDGPLGKFIINWERVGGFGSCQKIIVDLAPIGILHRPLYLESSFLDSGCAKIKTPFIIKYKMKNLSARVYDLCFSMDSTEAFMSSGPRKVLLKLRGKEETKFTFILFPLISGLVGMPKLNIDLTPSTIDSSAIVHRNVPAQIFVSP